MTRLILLLLTAFVSCIEANGEGYADGFRYMDARMSLIHNVVHHGHHLRAVHDNSLYLASAFGGFEGAREFISFCMKGYMGWIVSILGLFIFLCMVFGGMGDACMDHFKRGKRRRRRKHGKMAWASRPYSRRSFATLGLAAALCIPVIALFGARGLSVVHEDAHGSDLRPLCINQANAHGMDVHCSGDTGEHHGDVGTAGHHDHSPQRDAWTCHRRCGRRSQSYQIPEALICSGGWDDGGGAVWVLQPRGRPMLVDFTDYERCGGCRGPSSSCAAQLQPLAEAPYGCGWRVGIRRCREDEVCHGLCLRRCNTGLCHQRRGRHSQLYQTPEALTSSGGWDDGGGVIWGATAEGPSRDRCSGLPRLGRWMPRSRV